MRKESSGKAESTLPKKKVTCTIHGETHDLGVELREAPPSGKDHDAYWNGYNQAWSEKQLAARCDEPSHKFSAAQAIVEYVRTHHNSRSDKLMELIAEYDGAQHPEPSPKCNGLIATVGRDEVRCLLTLGHQGICAAKCEHPEPSKKWMSVEERLPEDGQHVFGWDGEFGFGVFDARYPEEFKKDWTHWMPEQWPDPPVKAEHPEPSPPTAEVFSRPECPFNYCDTKDPHTECLKGCRHA